MSERINKEATVTAMYFGARDLTPYPRRIECDGTTYTFKEGLQLLIKKGQGITRIFDMTDGIANYRLRYEDDGSRWTLLAIAS